MQASHRAHREWTPAELIACGERIGVACAALVRPKDYAPIETVQLMRFDGKTWVRLGELITADGRR